MVKGNQYDYLVSNKTGHVRRIEKDRVVDLCMHIKDRHSFVPTDNVIGMKLYIEGKEKEFNQQANNHGVYNLHPEEQEFLQACNL